MMPSPAAPLEIYLLGQIEVEDALRLQRRLVYERGERPGGALVLCEHPATITIGRSGSRAHIKADDDWLGRFGVRTHWVGRGGGCVMHLPGQLAAYLVLPLEPLGLDLGRYVAGLHRALVGTLAEFDLEGRAEPGASGVFLGGSRVASVGVAVHRWIAHHGLTLNVGPFLGPLAWIEEPGPDGRAIRQTSMEARRQRPAPMAKVREALLRQIEATFGLERHVLFTDHATIRRKAQPHAYVSSLG